MLSFRWVLAGGLATLSVSCGGSAGEALRPKDYSGTEALGASAPVCQGAPKFARPLTVDLDPDTRSDLEAQMSKGVVVVAYDCASLRVLSNCKVEDGNYDYAGVSPKEEVVRMKAMNELKTNLPMGSASLAGEIGSGRTVDLALVSIGRRSTTVARVERPTLTGECTGATHFIQKAFVGAFSIATGSAGKAAAVAEIFKYGASGSSTAERSASRSDGSLEACRDADPDGPKPPSQCRSPLRVELTPIVGETPVAEVATAAPPGEKARRMELEAEENPCPSGYKLVGGLCSQDAAAAFLCDPNNEAECRTQCDKGSADSCTNLGAYIVKHAASTPDDWEKANREALPFFKKACDGGHVEGCAGWARVLFPLEIKKSNFAQVKQAIEIGRKACGAGSAAACQDVAVAYFNGASDETLLPPNHDEAVKYFERACALGNHFACGDAGEEHINGTPKLPKNPAKAVALWSRGCDGGEGSVCTKLADGFLRGTSGITKDTQRGLRAARHACDLDPEECFIVADWVNKAGKPAEAFSFVKRGCETKASNRYLEDACTRLGDYYAAGTGTAKDTAKARQAWTAACETRKQQTPTSYAASAACRKLKN